jgi:hypothetical protein
MPPVVLVARCTFHPPPLPCFAFRCTPCTSLHALHFVARLAAIQRMRQNEVRLACLLRRPAQGDADGALVSCQMDWIALAEFAPPPSLTHHQPVDPSRLPVLVARWIGLRAQNLHPPPLTRRPPVDPSPCPSRLPDRLDCARRICTPLPSLTTSPWTRLGCPS